MVAKLLQAGDYFRGVLEEVGATGLASDQDAAIADVRIKPFWRDPHAFRHNFDANPARFAGPTRPLRLYSQSGCKPDALHGDGKDAISAVRRSMPFSRQNRGNLLVGVPNKSELQDTRAHLRTAR